MIKKTIFHLFLFLCYVKTFAQDKQPVSKGTITITTNQKIDFTDLKYVDNQVVFTNTETKSQCFYLEKTIKTIEDDQGNVIYSFTPDPVKVTPEAENVAVKQPVYPESGEKKTVRVEIILVTDDTLHTNMKVRTNMFNDDLIDELSFISKISTIEHGTKKIYTASEVSQLHFTDYKNKKRTFVRRGDELIEKLYDGQIKWFRHYYQSASGSVASSDYLINYETKEVASFGMFNGVRRNLKKITKSKPELIPLIDKMETNESSILDILRRFDKK